MKSIDFLLMNGTSCDFRSGNKAFFSRPNKFDRGTPTGVFTKYIWVPLPSVSLAVRLLGRPNKPALSGAEEFGRGTRVPLVM